MANLNLRQILGRPLTHTEADGNFTALNTEVGLKLDATDFNASNILTLLKTVDGSGSGLDADLLDGLTTATAATALTIVSRDGSGNFAANVITADLHGDVVGNVTGDVDGDCSGTALTITQTLPISKGGTGGTSQEEARDNIGLGSIATQDSDNISITGGSISGITDLAIADGGTGASTQVGARANLGLIIGSDVQPYSSELTAIAGLTTTGMYVRTGTNTVVNRTITAGPGISVTNGDGIDGNPTITSTGVRTVDGQTGDVISVPIGSIFTFAMTTVPQGYLTCNGAAVGRNTYPALFNAIGTTYGAGNGSTTFNLPDLRGEFIRGWDNGRGIDPYRIFGTLQPGTLITTDNGNTPGNPGGVGIWDGYWGGSNQNGLGYANPPTGVHYSTGKNIGADSYGVNWQFYTPRVGGTPGVEFVAGNNHTWSMFGPGTQGADGYWTYDVILGVTRPRNVALHFCIRAA